LEGALNLTPDKRQQYADYMAGLQTQGITEEVPKGEVASVKHFLPHRGIWQKNKLRVVFDGSAGLNATLETGPNLTSAMIKIIVGARVGDRLMIFDIEGAFLAVAVHKDDRNHLAFLWMKPDGNLEARRFNRVPFGTNASPFLLQHALDQLLKDAARDGQEPLAERVRKGLFVDDAALVMTRGEDSEELKENLQAIFAKGGMRLHKFRETGDPGEGKILGVPWKSATDEISLALNVEPAGTKRELLRVFAGIYDPLGLKLPWSLALRLAFRELWVNKIDWDDPLPPDVQEKVDKCLAGAASFAQAAVPRATGNPDCVRVYADASPSAYCAALYVISGGQGTLLAAKARVAPLHPQLTLPRLELMGALLAARLYDSIKDRIGDCPARFYTDSAITLAWIQRGPASYRTFVRNRVTSILQFTDAKDWRKVASAENPADLATRGIPATELRDNTLWWQGPVLPPEEREHEDQDAAPDAVEEAAREERAVPKTRASMTGVRETDTRDEADEFEMFIAAYGTLSALLTRCTWAKRWRRPRAERPSGRITEAEKVAALEGLLKRSQELHADPPQDAKQGSGKWSATRRHSHRGGVADSETRRPGEPHRDGYAPPAFPPGHRSHPGGDPRQLLRHRARVRKEDRHSMRSVSPREGRALRKHGSGTAPGPRSPDEALCNGWRRLLGADRVRWRKGLGLDPLMRGHEGHPPRAGASANSGGDCHGTATGSRSAGATARAVLRQRAHVQETGHARVTPIPLHPGAKPELGSVLREARWGSQAGIQDHAEERRAQLRRSHHDSGGAQ
jgi:hypothetical protein